MLNINIKVASRQRYRSPIRAMPSKEKTMVSYQNMMYNPTSNRRYMYFAYENHDYVNILYVAICKNGGHFPNMMINSEDKLIFDVDGRYELVYPQTEQSMRRLVELINSKMMHGLKNYRYVIYTNNSLKYYYTNIFGQYWRANIIVVPLHA